MTRANIIPYKLKPKVPSKTTNINDILDKFGNIYKDPKDPSNASGGVTVCKKSILSVQFDHDVTIESYYY